MKKDFKEEKQEKPGGTLTMADMIQKMERMEAGWKIENDLIKKKLTELEKELRLKNEECDGGVKEKLNDVLPTGIQ